MAKSMIGLSLFTVFSPSVSPERCILYGDHAREEQEREIDQVPFESRNHIEESSDLPNGLKQVRYSYDIIVFMLWSFLSHMLPPFSSIRVVFMRFPYGGKQRKLSSSDLFSRTVFLQSLPYFPHSFHSHRNVESLIANQQLILALVPLLMIKSNEYGGWCLQNI